jgi:putative hydrolase of HD superfamily
VGRVDEPVGQDPTSRDELPGRLAVDSDTRRELGFLVTAHTLTSVTRVNRLLDDSRGETSAEHSWHLALAALTLAPRYAPGVDIARVLTMLVLHDLVEVETGDVPIYDEQARVDVRADEQAAAERLFGRLPVEEGRRLLELWREGEAASTLDARFAKALDRLQPMLVHWAGTARVWLDRGVSVEFEHRLVELVGSYWPPLRPVAAALIDDAEARGMFPDGRAEDRHPRTDSPTHPDGFPDSR